MASSTWAPARSGRTSAGTVAVSDEQFAIIINTRSSRVRVSPDLLVVGEQQSESAVDHHWMIRRSLIKFEVVD